MSMAGKDGDCAQVSGSGNVEGLHSPLSTSGRSPNVIRALDLAAEMGIAAAGLSGGDGGDMVGRAEPLLIVPTTTTARIQEMHIMLGQMLCGALERSLGLV